VKADVVRAELRASAVLAHYGFKFKRCGTHEVESSSCPRRADHSRRALTMNMSTGLWQCFPCDIKGDLLTFVAEAERLDVTRDFPAVLAAAAAIAGIEADATLDPARATAIRLEAEKADARVAEERRVMAAAAIPKATAHWQSLRDRGTRGEEYLASRGLRSLAGSSSVRFDDEHGGSPAIRLFDVDGSIRNVVRRRLPELGEPKTPGLYGCPTAGTLVHNINKIQPSSMVIVTEGVVDSLTALVAWPGAIVLGAHGAGNMGKVTHGAALKAAMCGAKLAVVPHDDRAGYKAASAATDAALAAGLSIVRGTFSFIKHGAKDLNDAWCAGWRPSA